MSFILFMQNFANGISLGGLYALIAIGYTMIYGILRLINFAHGDIVMIGAYLAFYGIALVALPWWLSFPLAIALTTALGIGVERMAYRPLRDAPRISVMISAIGVSLLLENVANVVFGGRPKAFQQPKIFTTELHISGVRFSSLTLFIISICLVLLVAIFWLVYRTKTGRAMRAVSRDFEVARLMGINVNWVVSFTFALGSGLAGVGAVMWAMKYPQLTPLMGVQLGLKCFIAAVVGGIGSVPGAMLGGLIMGVGEIMIVALLPDVANWKYLFSYGLLILILFIKPTGIMGIDVGEKA